MICAAVERCAGIDVGKKWLSVCILIGPLDGEPRVERRRFGVNVADLQQLRDWLCKEVGDGPTGHIQRMKMGEAGDGRERTPHWAFEPVRKFASGRVGHNRL
jgi:hypothetical protein